MRSAAHKRHPRTTGRAGRLTAAGLMVVAVAGAGTVLLSTPAGAASDIVSNCSGDPTTVGSLPYVVANASAGDTVTFSTTCPAGSPIVLSQTLAIGIDLTVTGPGPGPDALVVSGNDAVEVMSVPSGVTVAVSGLTMEDGDAGTGTAATTGADADGSIDGGTGGNAGTGGNGGNGGNGGGIDNSGTLTLTDTVVSSNVAGAGAAGGAGGRAPGGAGADGTTGDGAFGGSGGVGGAGGDGGNGGDGGGIDNSGSLTLIDTVVTGNESGAGGDGGVGGSAPGGAGGTATGTDQGGFGGLGGVGGNGGAGGDSGRGAGIDNSGTLSLTASTVSGNAAGNGGGGGPGGDVVGGAGGAGGTGSGLGGFGGPGGAISGFGGNGGNGGGGAGIDNSGTLSLATSTVSENAAGSGGVGGDGGDASGGVGGAGGDVGGFGGGGGNGGLVGDGGNGGNGGDGGGIDNDHTLSVSASTVSGNGAGNGGGGGSGGPTGGGAGGRGGPGGGSGGNGGNGGSFSFAGQGGAGGNGGGIDTTATATVINSTVAGNAAGTGGGGGPGGQADGGPGADGQNDIPDGNGGGNGGNGGNGGLGGTGGTGGLGGDGGALMNTGSLTLTSATIATNAAGPGGSAGSSGAAGGGSFGSGGAGNGSAPGMNGNGGTGGIEGMAGAAGSGSDGGGVGGTDGTTVGATIVADNAPANCDSGATVTDDGSNLDSGDSCGFTAASDLESTDPLLGPLQPNGGPTDTMAPSTSPHSPVIDVVPADQCPATDQRGAPRSAPCDIGAYDTDQAPFITAIDVAVSGSQTFGSDSPTFTETDDAPAGVTVTGPTTCTTVDGGTPITSGLTSGHYTIDGPSCTGLVSSNAQYPIFPSTTVGVTNGFVVTNDSTSVGLTAVPSSEPFGSEGSTLFTVTVTTGDGEELPATEDVTVDVGTTTCLAPVAPATGGGSGSCFIGNSALGAGAYTASATYPGDGEFQGSGPADAAFDVTLALTPPPLPNPAFDVPYSTTITAGGATAPTTFTEMGNLPDGITLHSNGVLSGTATNAAQIGTPFPFTVKATDSAHPANVATQLYTITVQSSCSPALTTIALSATARTGNFSGEFCVNAAGSGTYIQGTVHGTGTVTSAHGVTTISAFGTDLSLLGQKTTTTSTFTETAPAPMKAGTFTLTTVATAS